MASTAVFHLRQRSLLRIWLVTQVLVQVVFYAAFAGLLIQSLTNRSPSGGLARPGDIPIAIGGLLVVFALATVRGYILLQPPLRVDPEARTIKARLGSWPQPPLTFDEADAMELRVSLFHQLHLFGPLADMKGRIDPSGRYRLNLSRGARRRNGGSHRLASLLPTSLAHLGDGVVVAEPASWRAAIRLALFLNLRTIWTAESSAPEALDGGR